MNLLRKGSNLWRTTSPITRLMSTGGKSAENGLFNWNHPFFCSIKNFYTKQPTYFVYDEPDHQLLIDFTTLLERDKEREKNKPNQSKEDIEKFNEEMKKARVYLNEYLDYCTNAKGKQVYVQQKLYLLKPNLVLGSLLPFTFMIENGEFLFITGFGVLFFTNIIYSYTNKKMCYVRMRNAMNQLVDREKQLKLLGVKMP